MTTAAPARTAGRRRVIFGSAIGLFVAAVGVSAAALMAGDETVDTPIAVPVRVAPPKPAVVIGDSAISALRWVPNASSAIVGFEHTLDLESCRRLYYRSCFGREGRRPPTVYEALLDHGDNYHTLIVATGYNDGTAAYDESFVNIVTRARSLGYRRIVWWTLRSDVDYVSPGSVGNHITFAANNAVLRSLVDSGDYPEVVLADWGGYTAGKAEWFVTDGVHYRAIGAWAAADYLSRKMAFLDGRPCPVPTGPSEPIQDPCPDPDVTGPITDLEALYPIGEDGLLCYEIGDDRRFECRDDTHVLELTRELSLGMSGRDVGALQIRLQRLGYFSSSITSYYGTITRDAVSTYRSTTGLAPNGGVADVPTLQSLGFDTSDIVP